MKLNDFGMPEMPLGFEPTPIDRMLDEQRRLDEIMRPTDVIEESLRVALLLEQATPTTSAVQDILDGMARFPR